MGVRFSSLVNGDVSVEEMNLPNVLLEDRRGMASPEEGTWSPTEIEGGSLYAHVERTVERHIKERGDWVWLRHAVTGHELGARQTLDHSKRYAVLFQSMGIAEGDRIHLVVGNHNMFFCAVLGAWILGAVVSHGDVNLEAKSIAAQLDVLEAKMIVFTPETAQRAKEASVLSTAQDVAQLCFGEDEHATNALEELEKLDPANAPRPLPSERWKDDFCSVFWTSGTTGLPKAICHDQSRILNLIGHGEELMIPKTNLVTTLCFFHAGGFVVGLQCLLRNLKCCHLFDGGVNLKLMIDTIIELRPIVVTMGSHYYVQLAESDILAKADSSKLGDVKVIVPTGAAVPQVCEPRYKSKFPNLRTIVNCYGQSELGAVSYGYSTSHLGTLIPTVQAKVENLNTGEWCGPDEMGELCFSPPHFVMRKYLNRPEANETFFRPDGFCRSGDIGYFKEDGTLVYVDRLKEVIKYMNNHVSPTELEGILQCHPAVKESLVFGKPEPSVQELITAVVVLNPGKEATAEELIKFVDARVTDYKKIRGGVIFRSSVPRNSMGKLVRSTLRDWAKSQSH